MSYSDAFVTAVLGPTNTGKTHFAIDRMLSYKSGIMGFPLRLLAREVYDKLVLKCGAQQVALLTGEEKIVPRSPAYWICTVESMPLDVSTEFLAVDEIQLASDLERGHIFTQRLLYSRGLEETMFMGSSTIEPLIKRLVPQVRIISKARFSKLSYVAPKKLSRIPKRSAVVAFSAQDVYATADTIRRHRGGAAVVLGALSPRTRNAQVAMFQAGEVDYLVATDAIGMGLNMDLDHVTFTRLTKFDGRRPRRLNAAEIGQIAGRAGRYKNDGSFSMTQELGDLDPDIVEAVESHTFPPLEALVWRNPDLDFYDIQRLLRSLDAPSPRSELVRGREADDQRALRYLAKEEQVRRLALGPAAVGILWEVCQVPDFHKTMTGSHVKLLSALYGFLMGPEASIPEDWIAKQVLRLDDVRGDIDTLTNRLASIRTWTFISHRRDWLQNNSHWQGVSRQIEDRLSDALHERLTLQFVDQRAAVLMKARESAAVAEIKENDVQVEGQHVGQLVGLNFKAIDALEAKDARSLLSAAKSAMAEPVKQRLAEMLAPAGAVYAITDAGAVTWQGQEIGVLQAGSDRFTPKLRLHETNMLEQTEREALASYVETWAQRDVQQRLTTLTRLRDAELSGAAKGLAFQLVEAFGCLPREQALEQVTLDRASRKALKDLGVVFGRHAIWLGNLVRPRNRALRALLWSLHHDKPIPELPAPGLTARPALDSDEASFWQAMGFVIMGKGDKRMVMRADVLDNFADVAYRTARKATRDEPARSNRLMATLMGGDSELVKGALAALDYRIYDLPPEAPAASEDQATDTEAAAADSEATGQAAQAAATVTSESGQEDEASTDEQVEAPVEAPVEIPAKTPTEVPADAQGETQVEVQVDAAALEAEVSAEDASAEVSSVATTTAEAAETAEAGAGDEASEPGEKTGDETGDTTGDKSDDKSKKGKKQRPELQFEVIAFRPPRRERDSGSRHGNRDSGSRHGNRDSGSRHGNKDSGPRSGGPRSGGARNRPQAGEGEAASMDEGNKAARSKDARGKKPGKGKPRRDDDRRHQANRDSGGKGRPAKDKPMDPDSPFAVLAGLKDQLNKKAS